MTKANSGKTREGRRRFLIRSAAAVGGGFALGFNLPIGTTGVDATSHVSCLLFTSLIGGRATLIGYRGSGPALNDLITGQYDFRGDQIPHTIGHVEAGSIKLLALAQT